MLIDVAPTRTRLWSSGATRSGQSSRSVSLDSGSASSIPVATAALTRSPSRIGLDTVALGNSASMFDNPWDPRTRTVLTANERVALHFMSDCMHGDDLSLVDRYVAEGYIQHTPG